LGLLLSIKADFFEQKREENMDYQEYITFHVTAKDGTDVEMAVVDEFDFEDKHYVVGAVIQDDTVFYSNVISYINLLKQNGIFHRTV